MKTTHRKQAHAKRQNRDSFALWKVIARSTGFNEAEQTACALPVRLSWGALKGGTATGDDIATLTDVIAICTVAGQNMDALVEETCEAARRAMCAVADRYTRCQRWGVDAAALRDIPPIMDFYEELLRVSTGGQMEKWLSAVRGCKPRVHHMPPGPSRWKERSRTYEGIAHAMAAQWSPLLQHNAEVTGA